MMIDAGDSFAVAREPWIPKYVDILVRRNSEDAKEAAYYAKFGLDKCDWGDYEKLGDAKDSLVQMFEERYVTRRINSETLEIWQMRLQRRFDEVAPRYERALSVYSGEDIDSYRTVQTTTYNDVTDTAGGTNTVTGTVTDTPDTAINASHTYADSVTTTTDSGDRSNTRSGSVTVEQAPLGGAVAEMNASIDAYRNLVADFAGEFENLFLNVFWY